MYIEAYCLMKISSKRQIFHWYQQNLWLLCDSRWIMMDSDNVNVKSFDKTTSSSLQHVFP